jgi:AraC-like DNA-binding protein
VQLSQRTFREHVKATLKKTLAGQRPELRAVARELGVSTRALQRRLTDERITFQQLIAETRHELARHYLRHDRRDCQGRQRRESSGAVTCSSTPLRSAPQ